MSFIRTGRVMGLAGAVALLVACGGKTESSSLESAKQQLSAGDAKGAAVTLKSVLQKSPDSAEARYMLGRILLDAGDPVSAAIELTKAEELGHKPEVTAPARARALLLSGQGKKLIEAYAKTELAEATADADLKTTLAMAYQQAGDGTRAQGAMDAALSKDAKFAPALMMKARSQLALGQMDEAMKTTEAILGTSGDRADAWKLKGDIQLLSRSDVAAATQSYESALKANPQFMPAHVSLIKLAMHQREMGQANERLEHMRKALPRHTQTLYLSAELAMINGQLAQARDLALGLLRTAPTDVQVLTLAGAIDWQLGELASAKAHLEKALKVAPESIAARVFLTQTYLRGGEIAKAQAAIERVLQLKTPPVTALATAGEIALLTGDSRQAETYFRRVTAMAPDNVGFKTALALSVVAKGDERRGIEDLRALATTANDYSANLALISTLQQRGRLAEALAAAENFEKEKPDLPVAAFIRGRIHLLLKDTSAATAAFGRALKLDPSYFPAAMELGRLDIAAGRAKDARARFQAMVDANPKNYQARLAIIELKRRDGASPVQLVAEIEDAVRQTPNESTVRTALIGMLAATGDAKATLTAAQAAHAALPDDVQLLDALGGAQLAAKDYQQALSSFRRLVAAEPESSRAHMRLALALVGVNDRAAALQSLRQAVSKAPDLLPPRGQLVELLVLDKQWGEALAVSREAQKRQPARPEGYLWEGQVMAAQAKWEPALSSIRNAFARGNNSLLAVTLHQTLLSAGKSAEAQKLAAEWLSKRKDDVTFKLHLAKVAGGGQDWPGAESLYREVLVLDAKNVAALNNLAFALIMQGKPGAAAQAEAAVNLMPNQPALLDTLAQAFAADKQFERAIEVQNKAMALAPQSHELRLTLAKILLQAGRNAQARAELEKLAYLGDKFPLQAEVARLLSSTR